MRSQVEAVYNSCEGTGNSVVVHPASILITWTKGTVDGPSSLHSAFANIWETTLVLQAVDTTNTQVRDLRAFLGRCVCFQCHRSGNFRCKPGNVEFNTVKTFSWVSQTTKMFLHENLKHKKFIIRKFPDLRYNNGLKEIQLLDFFVNIFQQQPHLIFYCSTGSNMKFSQGTNIHNQMPTLLPQKFVLYLHKVSIIDYTMVYQLTSWLHLTTDTFSKH